MKQSKISQKKSTHSDNLKILTAIIHRAQYIATRMIYEANHRQDKEKGDPKIGGHAAACASALHITGALHLNVRTGFDFIANKPHASPTDHAYHYLLNLLLHPDLSPLTEQQAYRALMGLRKFSQDHSLEPVFQSYHSAYDPDHHCFLPSGSVGIPPVNVGYLALAYRYAQNHGYQVPKAHFWAIAGDSEFREGSMFEAVPEFAERELGNLTWILDYNRQSLDGHRITNHEIMGGSDANRIEKTFLANGWQVIQVRHGQKRRASFKLPGGQQFQVFLEELLLDYQLQALLQVEDAELLKKELLQAHPPLQVFLEHISSEELKELCRDLGGHDLQALTDAMMESKKDSRRPCLIIAHTLKGWGLESAASPGNHNTLPEKKEVESLQKKTGLTVDQIFSKFEDSSEEGLFLKKRGQDLLNDLKTQRDLKSLNEAFFLKKLEAHGPLPESIGVNLKLASYPHTQWMLGQLNAKLNRCANADSLSPQEQPWKTPGELIVAMAPDVGTSTNLNPLMDGKIFGANLVTQDSEKDLGVKNSKLPDLIPGQAPSDRFIRFEIAESNTMSCMGSFGRLRDILGIPLLPLMTVYDFFIKRALDQYFYNLYWKSSYILVGTPSGVTLSPEGAQHGWKSDFQIPNQITWEPFFCLELDWILAESLRLHLLNQNQGRSGVLIRCVTRGVEQKDFLNLLKRQKRFKISDQNQALHPKGLPLNQAQDESQVSTLSDEEILSSIRQDVLDGGYFLLDYRGYQNYNPGDNVVHILSMGSTTTEAVKASEALLHQGIYANIIVVTSPDLLCGHLGYDNDYTHLTQTLGLNAILYAHQKEEMELTTLAGLRIPLVSVHDGEPGLLDNLGSIVGVKHLCLAVRKHSKCGRPQDIYSYHGLDAQSVEKACLKVLKNTAEERITLR
jgi:pyruvate dehydrogenase E1 component